jgi:hypothetical protein
MMFAKLKYTLNVRLGDVSKLREVLSDSKTYMRFCTIVHTMYVHTNAESHATKYVLT